MLPSFRNNHVTEIADRLDPNCRDSPISDGLSSRRLLLRVMRTDETNLTVMEFALELHLKLTSHCCIASGAQDWRSKEGNVNR
jgi:hypothetical protein